MAASGSEFTFKRTGPPKEQAPDSADSNDPNSNHEIRSKHEGSEQVEPQSAEDGDDNTKDPGSKLGGSNQDDDPEPVTPHQCKLDEEMLKFLQSSNPSNNQYQGIVGLVSQMEVSSHRCFIYIQAVAEVDLGHWNSHYCQISCSVLFVGLEEHVFR